MSNSIAVSSRPVNRRPVNHRMSGFSYVEILIAVLLIAITLVPAMEALQPGIAGSGIHRVIAEDHYVLAGRLEQVLAESHAELETAAMAAGNEITPTTYSDIYTYSNGRQITRNIFISRYDGDNADTDDDPFTGTDDGLLWLRAEIFNSSLRFETLINE